MAEETDLVEVDFRGSDEQDLVEFGFAEVDEKDFETHLDNKGVEQRTNVTGQDQLRKKGVVLCGKMADVVHGHTKTGGDPCTLLIFEWYVVTRKPGMRIRFARIDVTFRSSRKLAKYDPWVIECAPHGPYSLFETERTVETTKSWKPTLKLGQEGIATFELPFLYELKETIDREEQVYVDGTPLPPEDNSYVHPDHFSAVQWNLFENEGQRSGIPRYFRTAVLVSRAEGGAQDRFTASVTTGVKVSWSEDNWEKVKGYFGKNVRDEALIFNPTLPPKTDRFADKTATLGSVDLDEEMGFLLFRNRKGGKDKTKEKDTAAADGDNGKS